MPGGVRGNGGDPVTYSMEGSLKGFLSPGRTFNDGLSESIRPIYLSVVESFLCLKTAWISIIGILAFARILAVRCLIA